MYRQFRIYYLQKEKAEDEWTEDEVEFDTEDAAFTTMFNDLIGLFNDFCKDEKYSKARINYIIEVPYDGEM